MRAPPPRRRRRRQAFIATLLLILQCRLFLSSRVLSRDDRKSRHPPMTYISRVLTSIGERREAMTAVCGASTTGGVPLRGCFCPSRAGSTAVTEAHRQTVLAVLCSLFAGPPFRVVKHLSRRFGTFRHLSAPLHRPQPTWSDPRTARIISGFAQHFYTVPTGSWSGRFWFYLVLPGFTMVYYASLSTALVLLGFTGWPNSWLLVFIGFTNCRRQPNKACFYLHFFRFYPASRAAKPQMIKA